MASVQYCTDGHISAEAGFQSMGKDESAKALTCPVCGSANLRSFKRQNGSLPEGDSESIVSRVLGHQCENGHVSIAAALHLD